MRQAVLILCTLSLTGCTVTVVDGGQEGADTSDDSSDGSPESLRSFLTALDPPSTPTPSAPVVVACGPDQGCMLQPDPSTSEYACGYQLTTETKIASTRLVALGPDPDLWPGNLLRSSSASRGELDAVALPLGGGTVLSTLRDSEPVQIDTLSASAFAKAMDTMLAGQTEPSGTAVSSHIDVVELFSQDELSKVLGLGVETVAASPVPAALGLSTRESTVTDYARVAVMFTQSYFQVTIEPQADPSKFLADDVTVDDVRDAIGDDVPVYVRSVTYGRHVVAVFEDEERRDSSELSAQVNALYAGLEGSASFEKSEAQTVRTTKFSALVLGDDRTFTNIDDLFAYLEEPPNMNAAWPIGYTLQYLGAETPFSMAVTTEVVTRSCATCGRSDPYADASTFSAALSLTDKPISDNDSDGVVLEESGVLPPGQERWFTFDGTDALISVVDPQASLSTPNAGAEVCVFADCKSGGTTLVCLLGEPVELEGLSGCCSTMGDAQLTGDGSLCPDKVSDDATVYVRVALPSDAEECVEYGLNVHY